METISTITELRQRLSDQTGIVLIPTMGNLHAGHIHLVELAKKYGQCVVVSIFVNPLQFGPHEDLASYPRTLDADLEKLTVAGVDFVFTPTVGEMYPAPQSVSVTLPPIADQLCGATRPGHFAGVATVVLKLFNVIQPAAAVFGKKDFQQLFLIRHMVKQLNLPIEIIAGETVRESLPEIAGLAMSSRNGYLSPQQRVEAKALSQALQEVVKAVQAGSKDFANLEMLAAKSLSASVWDVDYISVRSASTLAPATCDERDLVVLGAAKLGKTRLIDNIEFTAKP